jgi:hypothetical protein
MSKIDNATSVKAYGQWFIVTADSVEERQQVENRARSLWLDNREPTLWEWVNLESIPASEWLQ